MTTTATTSCLTREEQATLKTALAFVVLRNRSKRRKTTESPDTASNFPFCRNLLTPAAGGLPPPPLCDTSHIASILQIALSAASPLDDGQHLAMVYTESAARVNPRLESVASHLARNLVRADEEWMMKWIEEVTLIQEHDRRSKDYSIQSICCVWHCVADQSIRSGIGGDDDGAEVRILKGVAQLLGKIYNDQVTVGISNSSIGDNRDADTVVVNLLLLLEALISMRLEATNNATQLLKVLVEAVNDQTLTLPIAVENMPSFCHQQESPSLSSPANLSPSSKILLHLSLYDLTLKLAT